MSGNGENRASRPSQTLYTYVGAEKMSAPKGSVLKNDLIRVIFRSQNRKKDYVFVLTRRELEDVVEQCRPCGVVEGMPGGEVA